MSNTSATGVYNFWIKLRKESPAYSFLLFMLAAISLSLCLATIGSIIGHVPKIQELACESGIVVKTLQPRTKKNLNSYVIIHGTDGDEKYESRIVSKVLKNATGKPISFCHYDSIFIIGGHLSLSNTILEATVHGGSSFKYSEALPKIERRFAISYRIFVYSALIFATVLFIILIGYRNFIKIGK